MIDHNDPTPLYRQLKETIEKAIKNGELKNDEKIPSERELCDKYNVSRITVRQAISEAVNEGLLYKIQGKGTFVKQPKIEQRLVKMTSFSKTLLSKGLYGSTKIVKKEIVPVNFEVANILKLDLSEQVVNLDLIGLANDEPVVYYNSYFSFDIGNQIIRVAEEKEQLKQAFSSFELYNDINIVIERVDQTFEAINCNREIADLLEVPQGTALLVISSIIYSSDKKPIEFKTAMYRADKYRFHITRDMV